MLTSKTHKNNWIKSLLDKGLTFDWIIIENLGDFLDDETRDAALNAAEIKWIKHYRDLGLNLTNSTDGGEGTRGNVLSPESREKMSKKRKEYYENNPVDLSNPIFKRKEHQVIDGIEKKHCSCCDKWKSLDEYSNHKGTWDKKATLCKICFRDKMRERRAKNPPKKLSAEEWKQSYVNRKEKMRQGVIESYKNNPELGAQTSEARSKPIVGTTEYGDIIEFDSALEAKKAGFQNSNIGQAIRSGKLYKGYYWKFK
jgi:hypothetical protein